MAHVVLKDLVKTYGSFKAVNDVSLTVNDGEFVALVGPSGCGKTTTLNLVAGLIPITSGDIVIGDRVVNDLDPKDRDIAMVFQNYALYPQKSVYKNLAFPLQMRKLPRDEIDKKVKEAARVLDMTHLLERKSARTLGRPAAARGPGPRPGARPGGIPDGRAALQSRRQAARADAVRNQAVPSGPEGDDHLCDARPARGRDHGRQDGCDERRLSAAIRFAGAGFRPSREHVRRELHRQPGDEPYSAGGIDGKRRHRADERGRLEPRAVATQRAQGRRERPPRRSCSARDTRRSSCTRARSPAPFRPRPIRWSRPETSPSCRRSCPAPSSTSACPPNIAVAPDEQIWLEFDQERMHLFDGETEMALKAD